MIGSCWRKLYEIHISQDVTESLLQLKLKSLTSFSKMAHLSMCIHYTYSQENTTTQRGDGEVVTALQCKPLGCRFESGLYVPGVQITTQINSTQKDIQWKQNKMEGQCYFWIAPTLLTLFIKWGLQQHNGYSTALQTFKLPVCV